MGEVVVALHVQCVPVVVVRHPCGESASRMVVLHFGKAHGARALRGGEQAAAGGVARLRHVVSDSTVLQTAVVHEATVSVLVRGGRLVVELAHEVARVAFLPDGEAHELLDGALSAEDVGAGLVAQKQVRFVGAGVEAGHGAATLAGAAAVRERERRPVERTRRRRRAAVCTEHGVQRRVARDLVAQRAQAQPIVAESFFILQHIGMLLVYNNTPKAIVCLVLGDELVAIALDALALGFDGGRVDGDESWHS